MIKRICKYIKITNEGTKQEYYSLPKSIYLKIKWNLTGRITERHIKRLIRKGYLGEDLEPLICPYCKSTNIKHCNHEVGGYNIPEGCVTEYDAVCDDCKHIVGHWAYGYWQP